MRRSIWMARRICLILAPSERLSRGSISRASCIDSVEPPETMRPLPANWPAARSSASDVDALMVPEALVLVGDQHLRRIAGRPRRDRRRAASARPASRRRAAARRRGRRLRSRPGRPRQAAAERRGRPIPARPRPSATNGRAACRGNRDAASAPVMSGRLDLHHAGGGAGRELRPVHVLDARRRMGVDARRHRAHDIGQRERAVGIALVAVERRDETVVAEFEMRRLGLRQPGEVGQVGAVDQAADCRSRSRPATGR